MKYLLLIFIPVVFLLSGMSAFAQSNIIAGSSSAALSSFKFDPFQHPYLLLLNQEDEAYSLKSRGYRTTEETLNSSALQRITSGFSAQRYKPIKATVLMQDDAVQITFLVINDTDNDRWVLDLAPSLFLPQPIYGNVSIYNALTNKVVAKFENHQTKGQITLAKNIPYLLTLSAKDAKGYWGAYNPKLYKSGSTHDTNYNMSEIALLALGLGIFMMALVILNFLPMLISLPTVLGWGIFAAGILANTGLLPPSITIITPLLYILWLPFIVIAQREFLRRRNALTIIFVFNLISLISALGMALSAGLYAAGVSPQIVGVSTLALFIISCGSSAVVYLLLTLSEVSKVFFLPFIGWVFLFMGATIAALGFMGTIPESSFVVTSYYGSALIFGVLWTFGLIEELKTSSPSHRGGEEQVSRTVELSQKLQEAREGFDNVRLVQVLKRERQIMKELREKDAKLTQEMTKEKEKADYANQAKSAFLAVISHEIRTPMTGIMGMVRLLRHSKLSEEQDGHVDTISDSGDAMMALLNDILDYEKIDKGKMALESIEFDFYNLLKNVQSLMLGRAEEHKIDLKLEVEEGTPQHIHGDPTRLRQILLNLISNAIKFTHEGHVSIQARKLEHKDGRYLIYLAIKDTGLGIAKEAQEGLFNPFSQADTSTNRKYGGSGLGLAICQKLINAMGGSISINSAPEEGSTFFFSILAPEGKPNTEDTTLPPIMSESTTILVEKEATPSDKAPSVPTKAPEITRVPETPTEGLLNILVVDDNAINQKVVGGLIAPSGHKTKPIMSGQAAIEELKANPDTYDLIFMDIEMPGISGVETTRIIREELNISIKDLPIIALTGNTGDEQITSYMAIGMTGFLAKPIDPDQLEDILNTAQGKEDEGDSDAGEETITPPDVSSIKPLSVPKAPDTLAEISPQEEYIPAPQPDSKTQAPAPEKNEATEEKNITIEPKKENLTLPTDMESGLVIDEDTESYTPEPQPEAEKPRDTQPALDELNTGLSIDEPTEEEQKEAKEYAYNPADFDSSTLMTLKTSMEQPEMTDLINDLMKKLSDLFSQISTSVKGQKLDLVRARTHDLKGMSGNFGLVGVSSRATLIEDTIKTGAPSQDALNKLNKQLEEDIQQAILYLEKWA